MAREISGAPPAREPPGPITSYKWHPVLGRRRKPGGLLPPPAFALDIIWSTAGDDLEDDALPYHHWLAITDHQDGAYFIVLDTDEQKYYLMDACGADLTCPAGKNVEELLNYLWENWVKGLG